MNQQPPFHCLPDFDGDNFHPQLEAPQNGNYPFRVPPLDLFGQNYNNQHRLTFLRQFRQAQPITITTNGIPHPVLISPLQFQSYNIEALFDFYHADIPNLGNPIYFFSHFSYNSSRRRNLTQFSPNGNLFFWQFQSFTTIYSPQNVPNGYIDIYRLFEVKNTGGMTRKKPTIVRKNFIFKFYKLPDQETLEEQAVLDEHPTKESVWGLVVIEYTDQ